MRLTEVIAVGVLGARQWAHHCFRICIHKSQCCISSLGTRRLRTQSKAWFAMWHNVFSVRRPLHHYAYDMTMHRTSRHRHSPRNLLGPIAGPRIQRGTEFSHIVESTLEYLKTQWPKETASLHIAVHSMPPASTTLPSFARWRLFPDHNTIWLYRVPIERLTRLHRNDAWHRRVLIESVVFAAVAELLGTDPGNLGSPGFPRL